jgi:DNA gyrase subunit B
VSEQKNSYDAKDIKVLSGLEGVRMRPAMYIGNTGEEGLHHLVYEVVDNSIDEALAGYCTHIKVTIHRDDSVSVEDDGRGIPVAMHPTEKVSALELVMCTLHAGGKFDHSTYKVSGGLHGVGVSVVNALSMWTTAEIKRDGKIHQQSYEHGIQTGPVKVIGDSELTGTRITFKPDPTIFTETLVFKYETIQNRLRELAFLNREVKIALKDERNGAEDEFHFEGGITEFVGYLNRNRTAVHAIPIFIEGEKDGVQVEVAFQYYTGYSERLFAYVNNIFTREGGTHVTGFRGALTKCINRYASEDVVPKNLREKMEGDDVREGITCVISVRVPNPQFEGQTKTKLGNSEVKSIVESICNEKLGIYLEQNPLDAKAILSKVVDAAAGSGGGAPGQGIVAEERRRPRSADGRQTGRVPVQDSRRARDLPGRGRFGGRFRQTGSGSGLSGHPPPARQDHERRKSPLRQDPLQRGDQADDRRPGHRHRQG